MENAPEYNCHMLLEGRKISKGSTQKDSAKEMAQQRKKPSRLSVAPAARAAARPKRNLFVLMKANATWSKRHFKLFLLLFENNLTLLRPNVV